MKLRKPLCLIGWHKYRSVDCTSFFHTNVTDKGVKQYTINHMVWYQQCSCCGKRILKDTVKKDMAFFFDKRHNGVEKARVDWVEHGIMYLGNGNYKKPQPPAPIKLKLKVITGGK